MSSHTHNLVAHIYELQGMRFRNTPFLGEVVPQGSPIRLSIEMRREEKLLGKRTVRGRFESVDLPIAYGILKRVHK